MKYILPILLLSLFSVVSCNLRNDELPVTSRTTFIPPTSPELVIVNLQYAIIEKDLNNYMMCFIDTNYNTRKYSYIPDVISGIQYPVFRFWNTTNEKGYYNKLLSLTDPASTSNLFFSEMKWENYSDTAIFDARYLMRFDHTSSNVSKNLKGKLRIILSSDSRNLWAIHKWIDFQSVSTDTTWSVLRGVLSY